MLNFGHTVGHALEAVTRLPPLPARRSRGLRDARRAGARRARAASRRLMRSSASRELIAQAGTAAAGRRSVCAKRSSAPSRTTRKSSTGRCTSSPPPRIGAHDDADGRDREGAAGPPLKAIGIKRLTGACDSRYIPSARIFVESGLIANLQASAARTDVAVRLVERAPDRLALDFDDARAGHVREAAATDRACASGFSGGAKSSTVQVEVLRMDGVAVGENHRPLETVLQLAHIARPGIRLQRLERRRRSASAASCQARGTRAR